MTRLPAEPLTAQAFAPFGDVIAPHGSSFGFNGGMAQRFHDLARVEAVAEGRLGLSMAVAQPWPLPLRLTLVERHPLGSQAFVPLDPDPFLVIVAPDGPGGPGRPRVFLTRPGEGVNYLRGTWHGVLTPFMKESRFLILDRIGPGSNLEEHVYPEPWVVQV